jgi:hypothetical protein
MFLLQHTLNPLNLKMKLHEDCDEKVLNYLILMYVLKTLIITNSYFIYCNTFM